LLDRTFASIDIAPSLASLHIVSGRGGFQENGQNGLTQDNKGNGKAGTPTGRYAAQVGAYYRYNQAEHAATNAARRLPESLSETLVWIPKVSGRNGSLFLARLVGLTQDDAKEACEYLRAAAIDCLEIKVTPPTSVALN
jgi:hypothetical protein